MATGSLRRGTADWSRRRTSVYSEAMTITDADLARLAHVLTDAAFPELPNFQRGKVRDSYDLPDGRRVMVATDRQSAFDHVLAAVPHKGQVLNQTARFWFERTADIGCPLLFHFGADDANPSPEDMQVLDRELARHGKPHEFHTYPGAGHAFMDFTSSARYREMADRLSWPRTLQFLARYLGGG